MLPSQPRHCSLAREEKGRGTFQPSPLPKTVPRPVRYAPPKETKVEKLVAAPEQAIPKTETYRFETGGKTHQKTSCSLNSSKGISHLPSSLPTLTTEIIPPPKNSLNKISSQEPVAHPNPAQATTYFSPSKQSRVTESPLPGTTRSPGYNCSPRSSSSQSFSQRKSHTPVPNSFTSTHTTGGDQQEGEKLNLKPGFEPGNGCSATTRLDGRTKHAGAHLPSDERFQEESSVFSNPATEAGKSAPTKGKTWKSNMAGPSATTASSTRENAAKDERSASGLSFDKTTLLESLSYERPLNVKPLKSNTDTTLYISDVTQSLAFPSEDVIDKCKIWSRFTLAAMRKKFPFTEEELELPKYFDTEPQFSKFSNEYELQEILHWRLLRKMRYYFRTTFGTFEEATKKLKLEPVIVHDGYFMRETGGSKRKADFGVYNKEARDKFEADKTSSAASRPVNRLPIEVKPAYKCPIDIWSFRDNEVDKSYAEQASNIRPEDHSEFVYTPLAQVHYYMTNSGGTYAGSKYGMILTDRYLIPVKRTGKIYGELLVGRAIPMDRSFKKGEKIADFTVSSAFFYLGLLAAGPDWCYRHKSIVRKLGDQENVEKVEWKKQEK